MSRLRRDIKGMVFDRLTVLEEKTGGKNPTILCQCACGVKVIVLKHNVLKGNTKSCGCLRSEKAGRYVHKKRPKPEKTPKFEVPSYDLDDFEDESW